MIIRDETLLREERASFALRELYAARGYSQYKMSKFEEYDLYVRNKDYLISDRVITFTDSDGRLLALKPDVTLSIIKNGRDRAGVQKVYYGENVYRSSGDGVFREIPQVGLECIGDVDAYCLTEVLTLAARSLQRLSPEAVLCISHLGIPERLLDCMEFSPAGREEALAFLGEKNLHELTALCRKEGVEPKKQHALARLLRIHGSPGEVLPELRGLLGGLIPVQQLDELQSILEPFAGTELETLIKVDFSVACNMKYYNGIVFSGFLRGVPSAILTGGQYDRLMEKLGRKARAVGFAVYLDLLELLPETPRSTDVDTLLLYEADSTPAQISSAVELLQRDGGTVAALPAADEKLRPGRVLILRKGEVVPYEYA